MAKSLVERYEQLLAQDPASSVFVELAKALIAKGEHARAISVCEQGISHHPNSVTGRVLWGKALILMGRPAEAMAQFDQAIAIDKENPHAYNLISEVLLQRGLFRSALPILRKALALQPNDGRVRGWMEQAQAALAGGPAPAFGELNALEPQAEASASEAPPEAPADAAPASEEPAPDAETAETPVGQAPPEDSQPVLALDTGEIDVGASPEAPPAEASEAAPSEAAPSEAAPSEDSGEGVSTEEVPLLLSAEIPITSDVEVSAQGEAASADEGGLLADLPPLEAPAAPTAEAPPVAEEPPTVLSPAHAATGSRRGLLEELPEATTESVVRAPVPAAAPVSRLPAQDVAALTAAYERELREKLLPKGSDTFFSGRTLKVMGAVAIVVVLLGVLLVVRAKQGGQALVAALDRVSRQLEQDTESSRKESLALLSHVVGLEDDNTRAWALSAYAHALRYADNASAEERAQALAALDRPGVRAEHPVSALLVDVLVADAKGRDAARRALVGAKVEAPEAQALAGAVLLEQGRTKEALERLERALKASPRNVRALVTLGGYYRDAGDPVNALKMYTAATKLAPEHPAARLGVAESRLVLGQELEQLKQALADVKDLAGDTLPVALRERQRLVQGRLMTALGQAPDARTLLAGGTEGALAYEAHLALGEANRAAGDMAAAQRAFEAALKLKPDSEDAKAGLGRVLLDRDREREVLSRVDGESRQVSLVRGAAYAKLGDWKRARVELARTSVEDRYPAEAIIYLAQADIAEGERDRAVAALEKTLAATKTSKAEVRTALGLLHWQDKSLDKASSLLEAAVAEDPRDFEAPCALGRLLISRGLPDLAMKPLTQAVERNGSHGEAREALGRALLALGRTKEALKQFEEWQLDNPGAPSAHKGFALALFHEGRTKEAEAASERAVKLIPNDPEAHRVRSDILFALGDTKGGFRALESANKLDSKSPETFCAIAFAFMRQGLVANAEKAFEAARREGPDTPCGRTGEHWVEDSGGRAAAKVLQGIAEKAPTTWDKAFAQAAMARVLLAAGATKDAREAADEAVRLAPFSGRNHLVLGQVALKQRDEATALKELSRAVELEPVDGLARLALADALVRNPAETAKAVEAYQSFLKLAAASPEAGRVKKALPALLRKAGGR
ncbi:tetratricopeptide repeat protein [Archangium violaceum]|uniref:tetratricopeptide repeat protein n=1 Tax=Archangium violaceum TaxID=83451 RepID=UPI00193C74C4|nr:tetratricopeptide repeat protein [Archangium violaceum]QRK08487.1 tetratricopeptide repeat protein [Archangium violaceum]